MRMLLALGCSILFAASLAAQPPAGFPPTLETVRTINPKTGDLELVKVINETVFETVEEKILVNGKEQKVTKTVARTVSKEVAVTISLPVSRVITPDGKQVPIDEVWKRLKKNSVVALSNNGDTPAPAFLRALGADTLVIIPGVPKVQAPTKLEEK